MNLKELLEKHGLKLNKKDMEIAQKIADELTKPLHAEIEDYKTDNQNMMDEIGEKIGIIQQKDKTIETKKAYIDNLHSIIKDKDAEIERLGEVLIGQEYAITKHLITIDKLRKQLTATNTVMGYLRKLISKFSWGRKDAQ